MKTPLFLVTILVTLTSALSVHAADRKLGNLILVERDIENIYTDCMKTISTSTKALKNKKQKEDPKQEIQKYFFCTIQVTQHPAEVMVNKGIAFFNRSKECQVESLFGNGKLLISFSTEKKDATPEDAKRCLRNTINANPDVIATIQTIE